MNEFKNALKMLPDTIQKLCSGELSLPHLVASDISMEEFQREVGDSEDHDRRLLRYEEGFVWIHEVPRPAHDGVLESIKSQIHETFYAIMPRNALYAAGTTDIPFGRTVIQPDASYHPRYQGTRVPTFIIQLLDSETIQHSRDQATRILTAPNDVRGVLMVKVMRFQRPAVPAVVGMAALCTVGDHTFSGPGFPGDPAPGHGEMAPLSELIFILLLRGAPHPLATIWRSGLGRDLAFVPNPADNVSILYPNIPVLGGNPGPFLPSDPNYQIRIPWGTIYYQAPGVYFPQNIQQLLANAHAAGAGVTIDPFLVWEAVLSYVRYQICPR